MLGSRSSPRRPDPRASGCNRVLVERAPRIEREFYLSHGRGPGLAADRRDRQRRGRRRHRGGRRPQPRGDPHGVRGPGRRPAGLPVPQDRDRDRAGRTARRRSRACSSGCTGCFRDKDCLLLEINPFIETEDGDLVALDAKMQLRRQRAVPPGRRGRSCATSTRRTRRRSSRPATGSTTSRWTATVGCIVNGAGLAMGTMDAIVQHGGRPANFLDVGRRRQPGEDRERVPDRAAGPERAGDPREHLRRHQPVRLDRAGVVQATRDQAIDVPVIVRLAGTNVEEGRAILTTAGSP